MHTFLKHTKIFRKINHILGYKAILYFLFASLLKYNWCTTPLVPGVQHRDSIFLYITNDHNGKSSYHLSLYKVITILLTAFPMLHITLLWHLFYNWEFVPFDNLYSFRPPPSSILGLYVNSKNGKTSRFYCDSVQIVHSWA